MVALFLAQQKNEIENDFLWEKMLKKGGFPLEIDVGERKRSANLQYIYEHTYCT